MDFENIWKRNVELEFPSGICDKIVGKLSRAQIKLSSISTVISKIEKAKSNRNEGYQNILALHLLCYHFSCFNDDNNKRLTKPMIADACIQIRDVSYSNVVQIKYIGIFAYRNLKI